MAKKIKNDEVCAWCGVHLNGVGHKLADDHVCPKCFRDHLVDKRKMMLFWKGVKANG